MRKTIILTVSFVILASMLLTGCDTSDLIDALKTTDLGSLTDNVPGGTDDGSEPSETTSDKDATPKTDVILVSRGTVEEYISPKQVKKLVKSAKEDVTLTLLEDITLDFGIELLNTENKSGEPVKIVFDGNGHTVSFSNATGMIFSLGESNGDRQDITLKNMKINISHERGCIRVNSSGSFLLQDVQINCDGPRAYGAIHMPTEQNEEKNPANLTMENVDISIPAYGTTTPCILWTGNLSQYDEGGTYVNIECRDCEWTVKDTEWSEECPYAAVGIKLNQGHARLKMENCYVEGKLHAVQISSSAVENSDDDDILFTAANCSFGLLDAEGTWIKNSSAARPGSLEKQTELIPKKERMLIINTET